MRILPLPGSLGWGALQLRVLRQLHKVVCREPTLNGSIRPDWVLTEGDDRRLQEVLSSYRIQHDDRACSCVPFLLNLRGRKWTISPEAKPRLRVVVLLENVGAADHIACRVLPIGPESSLGWGRC